ncbi:hypothetical protein [Enterococcus phoeniculicola]|jgi:hypothetical protein|uniref:ABC transporter permease n=1 Tax=Enterococcus phoeniculicola ATCC BAA-412 TaxID=1158610 RepID=R3WSA9_9ENTE|nr:hypothetical protein [Enterococcus phoeniculicola]EOL44715.1 hypothetical protein UC3_01532 [Enterococcus phoeniculicola ATCC BAA-412]EOT75004.1 hypothetical protein I589_02604 [Enterococcus phoeniculicola ATCC BAA-412]
MRMKQLLVGEIYQGKKSFFFFLLILLLTLVAFMTALPLEMLQRNSAVPSVKIALSMPVNNQEIAVMVGVLDKNDLVEKLEVVSPKEGRFGVAKGAYDMYIELPENFEEALFERQTGTIKLYAKNALVGNVVYQIIYEMVQTLNNLQSLSLDYYQVLQTGEATYSQTQKLSRNFDMTLIQMLLERQDLLSIHGGISQYPLQLTSLFLFLALSGISMFSGLLSNQQINQGTMKKLLFYNYPLSFILLVKYAISWLISLPFLWVLWKLSDYFGIQIDALRLLAGSSVLLLFLVLLTTLIAFLFGRTKKENRLFLLYASGAFLMLFLGGLIYPLYSQPAFMTQSNPAWYAQVVIEQSIQGAEWTIQWMLPLVVGSGMLLGILSWRWKKSS